MQSIRLHLKMFTLVCEYSVFDLQTKFNETAKLFHVGVNVSNKPTPTAIKHTISIIKHIKSISTVT